MVATLPATTVSRQAQRRLGGATTSPLENLRLESRARVGYGPNGLPTITDRLVGRERELAEIARRLLQPEVRLVSLVGAPGVGKTRLAVAAAEVLLEFFAEGIVFVDAAPLRERELKDALAVVGNRNVLVVLDNAEHLAAAVCAQLADLLARSPMLKLVVTSRAPLCMAAEHQVRILPLEADAAVALFCACAQTVNSTWHLTDDNASAVSDLCHQLDGLPLAIKLAAEWMQVLTPTSLLRRLTDDKDSSALDLLTSRLQDQPLRHRDLRAAIGWTYRLLTSDEQRLLLDLADLPAVFSLADVRRARNSSASGDVAVLRQIARLINSGLLEAASPAEEDGEPQFRLLSVVRAFALDQRGANEAERTLTPREREIAVLVSRGLTNRQIANELVISERTVGAHMENIFAKLGIQSRTQLAIWATQRLHAITTSRESTI